MIKLTMLVKRKSTITHEEFDRYWYDNHAPLVSSLQSTLNIIRYVQNIPYGYPMLDKIIQTSRQSQDFSFDGMAEIWWESSESMQVNRHL